MTFFYAHDAIRKRWSVAAIGLLRYVDLLLARFSLALAHSQSGSSAWQDTLNDTNRDAEFETWLADQVLSA